MLRYDKEHPNIFIIVEMQIVTAVNFHFLPIVNNRAIVNNQDFQ